MDEACPAEEESTIDIKHNPELGEAAEELYESLGLTLPEAIRLFLFASINSGGFPFEPEQTAMSKPGNETTSKRAK